MSPPRNEKDSAKDDNDADNPILSAGTGTLAPQDLSSPFSLYTLNTPDTTSSLTFGSAERNYSTPQPHEESSEFVTNPFSSAYDKNAAFWRVEAGEGEYTNPNTRFGSPHVAPTVSPSDTPAYEPSRAARGFDRTFAASKRLQRVLGLQAPGLFPPPPQLPEDFDERWRQGLEAFYRAAEVGENKLKEMEGKSKGEGVGKSKWKEKVGSETAIDPEKKAEGDDNESKAMEKGKGKGKDMSTAGKGTMNPPSSDDHILSLVTSILALHYKTLAPRLAPAVPVAPLSAIPRHLLSRKKSHSQPSPRQKQALLQRQGQGPSSTSTSGSTSASAPASPPPPTPKPKPKRTLISTIHAWHHALTSLHTSHPPPLNLALHPLLSARAPPTPPTPPSRHRLAALSFFFIDAAPRDPPAGGRLIAELRPGTHGVASLWYGEVDMYVFDSEDDSEDGDGQGNGGGGGSDGRKASHFNTNNTPEARRARRQAQRRLVLALQGKVLAEGGRWAYVLVRWEGEGEGEGMVAFPKRAVSREEWGGGGRRGRLGFGVGGEWPLVEGGMVGWKEWVEAVGRGEGGLEVVVE